MSLKIPYFLISVAASVNNPVSLIVVNKRGTTYQTVPQEILGIIAFSCFTSLIAGTVAGCTMGLSFRQSIVIGAAREIDKIAPVVGLEWIAHFSVLPLRDANTILTGAVALRAMNQNNKFLESLGYSAAHYYLTVLSLCILRYAIQKFINFRGNSSDLEILNPNYNFRFAEDRNIKKGFFFSDSRV